jgi:hypothetical protein
MLRHTKEKAGTKPRVVKRALCQDTDVVALGVPRLDLSNLRRREPGASSHQW